MNVGKEELISRDSQVLTRDKIIKMIHWLETEKARMEKEKQTFVRVDVISLDYKRIRARNFYYGTFRVREESLNYIERKYSPFVIRENKVFKINHQIGTCVKCESITDFSLVFEENPELSIFEDYKLETIPPIKIIERQINILNGILMGLYPHLKSILFGTYGPSSYKYRKEQLNPKLNSYQEEAALKALGAEDFHLILGPPGTGKTTLISELCGKFAARGERVLLTSWMNVAIDNALHALLKGKLVPEHQICRIGAGDFRIAEEILPLVLSGYLIPSELLRKKVVGSTLASAYKAIPKRVEELGIREPINLMENIHKKIPEEDLFDVVIVDEAGTATLPQTLLALVLGKKFILIGDHRQLPPVVSDEDCADWIKESLFEKLWKMYPSNHSMLHEQYRMDPNIADIVSSTIYRDLGGIQTPEEVRKRPTPFEGVKADRSLNNHEKIVVNKHPITWIDSSGEVKWFNFESSHSAKNDSEIENINKLLEILVENIKIDPNSIGVLSPFRYQVSTMVKGLETFIEKGVAVNTIHSFQGNEKDVIIISMVAKSENDSKIFSDIRLLNVALTRAKFKLIIVSDTTMVTGSKKTSQIMRMLFDSARKNRSYVAKDALNPQQNKEIRNETKRDQKIAETHKFLKEEKRRLGLYIKR